MRASRHFRTGLAPCPHQPQCSRGFNNHYSSNLPNVTTDAMSSSPEEPIPVPPITNYILGFLCVGLAWGFTTPFIRRAARNHKPPTHAILSSPSIQASWAKRKVLTAAFGVLDLLRDWRYAVPLLINLTGSVWFFLLIGQAGW